MGLLDDLEFLKKRKPKLLADVRQLQGPSEPYLRQQYPEIYGGLGGLLGMAPDEMAGSVLDPNTARVRAGAQIGFPVGTAAQVLPMARPAQAAAMATGRAGERFAERVVPRVMERGGMGAEMLQGMSRGTVSPVMVVAPNKTFPTHLADVKKEMETLGTPTIRAYWDGEKYIALEGSHRLQAAKELNLTPNIEEMRLKEWLKNHDFPDIKEKASTNRILDYLKYGTHPGSKYINFEDLPQGYR
jgi:hypothetical protein